MTGNTTFYVPIERKALPASDPKRWFIIEIEHISPVDAMTHVSAYVRDVMRLKGATIWAAVRDCPSFEYMQELRDSMDACRYARGGRKQGPIGSSVPGYC